MKKINLDKLKFWEAGPNERELKSEKVDLNKHWQRAFIFFVVLVLALTIYEIRMFFRIDQESIFSEVSPQSVKVENIDKGEIAEVLEYYSQKEGEFNQITSRYNGFSVGSEGNTEDEVEEETESEIENAEVGTTSDQNSQ